MATLVERGAPEANQRFRVIVSGNPQVERGDGEYGFRAMRAERERLRLSPYVEETTRVRLLQWWQYRYHLRVALILAPAFVLVLAIALGRAPLSRKRPWLVGITSMAAYLVFVLTLDTSCAAIARATALPPVIFAWLPTAVLLTIAFAISRATTRADLRCA
jgi:lipopolysaccharide export LptBFGC system permease protein LptF